MSAQNTAGFNFPPHDAKINSCFFVFVLFLSPLNAKIAWINETWTAFFNCNTKTFEFGLLAILSWQHGLQQDHYNHNGVKAFLKEISKDHKEFLKGKCQGKCTIIGPAIVNSSVSIQKHLTF